MPRTALQVVRDELILDGNARLNLATFVTTWMEPEAEALMAECASKNMIDKDEYPQTAELEKRCVNIIGSLWHAPHGESVGCSTTGSSEACMLGGMALLWRWRARRKAAGLDTARPNLVMGTNVQVCWEKFCRYWDVEPKYVPVEKGRYHLGAAEAAAQCDDNTIGVVVILGSTMDGSYEPVDEVEHGPGRPRRDAGRAGRADSRGRGVRRVRRAVPPAGTEVGLPGAAGRLDQHLGAQVRPGLPGRGLGHLARLRGAPRRPDLPGQLPRRRDADVRAELLPARRPGRGAVLQLHQARLLRLPARAADQPGHRQVPVDRDRQARPVRAAERRQRPAGVRVQAAR